MPHKAPDKIRNVALIGHRGSGKTSVAAHFADATCRAGERVLFFSFEESPQQIMRNIFR